MRFVKTKGLWAPSRWSAYGFRNELNARQPFKQYKAQHLMLCFPSTLEGTSPRIRPKGPVAGAKMSPVHGGPLQLRVFPQLPGGDAAAAAAASLQSCPTVRPHRGQPTRLRRPWDSPGKNTGVACHFLLQCMKVKSESEVSQSCPTLHNPMDCSPPGSSVCGIFQARVLEWGATAFSGRPC